MLRKRLWETLRKAGILASPLALPAGWLLVLEGWLKLSSRMPRLVIGGFGIMLLIALGVLFFVAVPKVDPRWRKMLEEEKNEEKNREERR